MTSWNPVCETENYNLYHTGLWGINDTECLFHIQHLLIQAWHVVVKPCRRDPALGELRALRKMRPVSIVLVFFLLPSQRPMKWYCYYYFLRGLWNCYYYFFNQLFCRVHLNSGLFYASYDLLWEVIYFFFYSWSRFWSRFHSHSGTDGQWVCLSVGNNWNDRILPIEWMCLNLLWRDTLLLKIWWKLWTLLLPKW